MTAILYLFVALELLLATYLLQPLFLLMLHYIRKLVYPYQSPVKKTALLHKTFDFAAVITAHQDTRFILPLVDSLLKQNYAPFHVYVVADACDISTLSITDDRVSLLKPGQDFHAKIKSIAYAIEQFVRPHDALIIFDSDNLVHPDYLLILNKYFQQGYRAVQTQMLSKNTQTVYAKLDSIGHIYHSFLERKMRMELGLSAHILGLGIAIECDLYHEIMYKDRLGGFDKKLQADMVKKIPRLAYAEEAIVYDEKVDDGQTLEKQRVRWLFTYFHYFRVHWDLLTTGFRRLDFNLIYFGYIVLRPPLVIVVGAAMLLGLINILINPLYTLAWGLVLFLYALSFILIVLTQSQQGSMGRALLHLPLFALRQLRALTRMKQAGKAFLKTEHNKVLYIEDLLK